MTDDTEGTGWIVWSGGEPVGAGGTQAEAVEHARSRGIDDGVAFSDSGRMARLVRLMLDRGPEAVSEDDARWALRNIITSAARGDRGAHEWLRTRVASREEIERKADWTH